MKNLNLLSQKYSKFILLGIFVIALYLRWLYLPQNAVSFAYDQARDAFTVQEILGGHFKILGPPVSGIPGLFHGVLYYYVISPAYYFSHGNPVPVAYYLSFIGSLGVFAVYFLTFLITKNKTPSLIAALFFAFSYEASQYADFLSNASMGMWFVPLIYIGLFLWINKKYSWAPLLTGLVLGLSIQSEVALSYHFIPIILWLSIYKKNIKPFHIVQFVFALLIGVFPMIIAEVKFGFKSFQAAAYILSVKDEITGSKNLSDYLVTFLDQSGKTFANTLFPINIVFGGLMGFIAVIISLKNRLASSSFLSSYIFAYSLVLPFGGWNIRHILVGVAPAVAILTAILIWKYCSKNLFLLSLIILIICSANVYKITKENKNGQTIFPLQPDLILSNEMQAVDYTYQKSGSGTFSISTLTSPLFVNTLWSYIYNWYGKPKYGYLPTWYGRDQVGQLGNNLSKASGEEKKHFFIREPTYGIPELWVNYAKGDQDAISVLLSESHYGEILVQERSLELPSK